MELENQIQASWKRSMARAVEQGGSGHLGNSGNPAEEETKHHRRVPPLGAEAAGIGEIDGEMLANPYPTADGGHEKEPRA
jgi:hypothetical protein